MSIKYSTAIHNPECLMLRLIPMCAGEIVVDDNICNNIINEIALWSRITASLTCGFKY